MRGSRNSFSAGSAIVGALAAVLTAVVALAGAASPPASGAVRSTNDASADLAIVQFSHSPEPAKAYDLVTYTVQVINHGPNAATNVSVVIDTPPGDWIVGPCGPPSGTTASCNIGSIGSGKTASVSYSIRIGPDGGDASASVDSATVPDPDPTNNVAVDTTTVEPRISDLNLYLNAVPTPGVVAHDVALDAVITNAGPDPAFSPPNGSGLTEEIDLPPDLQIVSVSPSAGTCTNTYQTDNKITCHFPTLAVDNSYGVEVKLRSPFAQVVTASASVTSSFAEDPNPADNSATVQFTVLQGYELTVQT